MSELKLLVKTGFPNDSGCSSLTAFAVGERVLEHAVRHVVPVGVVPRSVDRARRHAKFNAMLVGMRETGLPAV